jgi:hypothetical protein
MDFVQAAGGSDFDHPKNEIANPARATFRAWLKKSAGPATRASSAAYKPEESLAYAMH